MSGCELQCCAHEHYLQACSDCGTDFTEPNQQILDDELADRLVCGDADAPDGGMRNSEWDCLQSKMHVDWKVTGDF